MVMIHVNIIVVDYLKHLDQIVFLLIWLSLYTNAEIQILSFTRADSLVIAKTKITWTNLNRSHPVFLSSSEFIEFEMYPFCG